jgi:hypothetical protein
LLFTGKGISLLDDLEDEDTSHVLRGKFSSRLKYVGGGPEYAPFRIPSFYFYFCFSFGMFDVSSLLTATLPTLTLRSYGSSSSSSSYRSCGGSSRKRRSYFSSHHRFRFRRRVDVSEVLMYILLVLMLGYRSVRVGRWLLLILLVLLVLRFREFVRGCRRGPKRPDVFQLGSLRGGLLRCWSLDGLLLPGMW